MGFIPVLIALGGFFFLWGGVIYQTLARHKARLVQARELREAALQTYPARMAQVQTLAYAELAQMTSGEDEALQAELDYRRLRHTYNALVAEKGYVLFSKAFGFKPAR